MERAEEMARIIVDNAGKANHTEVTLAEYILYLTGRLSKDARVV